MSKHSPYGNEIFESVDAYHAQYEGLMRQRLEEIRAIIRAATPEAEEVISYNMPAFRYKKTLVYYAACKNHLGFYPTSSPLIFFREALKAYTTTKGSIHFPYNQPLPEQLIRDIVSFRLSEVK